MTKPPDNMAQVQFPLKPSLLGRSDSITAPVSTLPPIHRDTSDERRRSDRAEFKLAPIQSPLERDPPSRTASQTLSIANLLSSDEPSPKARRNHVQSPPQHPQSPFQYQFPSRGSIDSTNDLRAQIPPHPQITPHYHVGPSVPLRTPASLFDAQRSSRPQWRTYSNGPEPEQYQRSPASSLHSFNPGTRSSPSGSSPSLSITPTFPTPPKQRVSQPPPFNYNLSIRQQPVAARACGFGERDRRVIDPPPILELKITDRATGAPEQDYSAMLALHCTLLSQDGHDDETEVASGSDGLASTRRLMGTLVASPYQAKDENEVAGTFFVFPDLSCRSPGKYRLRFKLLRVDPAMMMPGSVHRSVASIVTEIFAVYTAKDFPGMRASSALLKALRRQGLNVGVKKGSDARKGRGRTKKEVSSDEDESDGNSNEGRRGSNESDSEGSAPEVSPKSKVTKGKRRRGEHRRSVQNPLSIQ